MAVVAQSGVPYEFPLSVTEEADTILETVDEKELIDRVDYTNDLVITIDGDDSKDFDDAVNVKKLDNGNYLLSVHIEEIQFI